MFRKRGSLADLKYKENAQRGIFGETDEKISREEYTLDWSPSKVFLGLQYVDSVCHEVMLCFTAELLAQLTVYREAAFAYLLDKNYWHRRLSVADS